MEYIIIKVPQKNDSVSRIVLDGNVYHIRFTYNDTKDFWKFGIMDSAKNPIVTGIKIVPEIVLNLFYGVKGFPKGKFGVLTKAEKVGHDSFANGDAKFIYVPK